ncbi:MAG TPA: peptidylprolyl isomerase, partial [Caldisericia bacterium]|nr:peptidylprolyl isomerase [Caldisericia bacterium]
SMLQATREDALNQLVEYAVYEDYAKKNGILPTSKEIDAAIASEVDARVHQAGSRQSLEKELTDLGGIEGLKETIKGDPIFIRQVIRQKVSDNVTKDLKVTKEQAKEFFESKLLGLSQIVVLYDEKIDGKELYEPTRKYAESLKAMIGKDKTFADVATMYSEERESGQNGGRMSQLVPKGYLPPQMEKVAFSLKIGEISDVIEANGSFVVLKMDYETYAWDYFFTDGGKKPKPNFEAVWKDVVNYLYTIKKIEAENNWYQKYADSIKIDVYLEL